MTQQVPATAVLGPGKTGLTIGLTVLNIDGTEYAAFSATGVAETSVAGTYRKADGVVVPDAGGYLVWGESGTDYAEATVDPAPLKPTVAGRTLAVDASGLVDLVPAPNATAVTAIQNGLATPTNITAGTITTVTTLTGHTPQTGDAYARLGAPVGASVSADIAAVASAVASVGAGDGTGFYTDTVESPTGTPVDGARVMLATDEDGDNLAYEARTNALGVFEMRPDPGTYYRFIEASGHTFTQGVEVLVEEA